MFGRKRRDARANALTETYIGQGTRFEGTLVVDGSLRVDGEVVGDIEAEGDVFIAESGDVKANVAARNLVVGGRLKGAADVTDRLELLATGRLIGDVTMQALIVEKGGLLDGRSHMRGPDRDGEEAIPLDPVG